VFILAWNLSGLGAPVKWSVVDQLGLAATIFWRKTFPLFLSTAPFKAFSSPGAGKK
jgi:hypothetical protein